MLECVGLAMRVLPVRFVHGGSGDKRKTWELTSEKGRSKSLSLNASYADTGEGRAGGPEEVDGSSGRAQVCFERLGRVLGGGPFLVAVES